MLITATRHHDFAAGHRVYGHESKCSQAHGHGYRVHFTCQGQLDSVGRVIDFSVIKYKLCEWLEIQWDHRFLLWEKDPWLEQFRLVDSTVVALPVNPTAENLASYLLEVIGPMQLAGTGVTLTKVVVEETRKCLATAEKEPA